MATHDWVYFLTNYLDGHFKWFYQSFLALSARLREAHKTADIKTNYPNWYYRQIETTVKDKRVDVRTVNTWINLSVAFLFVLFPTSETQVRMSTSSGTLWVDKR